MTSQEDRMIEYAQLERLAVERGAILRNIARLVSHCQDDATASAAAASVPQLLIVWKEDQGRLALERVLHHQHGLFVSTLESEIHRSINSADITRDRQPTHTAPSLLSSSTSAHVATATALTSRIDALREMAFDERIKRADIEREQQLVLEAELKNSRSSGEELKRELDALVATAKRQIAVEMIIPSSSEAVSAPTIATCAEDVLEKQHSAAASSPGSAVSRTVTAQFDSPQAGPVDTTNANCEGEEDGVHVHASVPLPTEDTVAQEQQQEISAGKTCSEGTVSDEERTAMAALRFLEDIEASHRDLLVRSRLDFFQLQMEEVHHRVFVERWGVRVLVSEILSVIVEMCNITCHRLYHEFSVAGGDIAYTAEAYRLAIDRHQTAQLLTMCRQRAADWMQAAIPRANPSGSPKKRRSTESINHDDEDEPKEVPQPPPPPVAMSPKKPTVADRVARFDALRKAREVRHSIGMYSPKRPVQVVPLLEAM
ncbi:Hypothetical protein, putative [Bodo saltans]|uniref:Uncharacterized protein n=1 Tax=Bodo saltans TaxID=75058 RepID=A0A0S4JFV0_BODSA|nr:Hypothetical protein, putative [Bodo saltans]|eukprot:CUG89145.1 Hypothetical protein, putative [Bodo saltans]